MELPPFMTPVMEQLVRPPSDAPVKREADQAEGQEGGEGDKKPPGEERGRGADKAMSTTEAQAGQGSPRRGRPADRLPGRRGGAARRRRRALGRRRGRRLGLPHPDRPRRGPPRGAGGRGGGPRRAGLPLRRVGPQDRGLPAGLVHAHRAPPDARPGGLRRGDLPRVRRHRHPDPAQLPADAPRGAAQDAPPGRRRRPRHRRPGRVRGRPRAPASPPPRASTSSARSATAT